MPIRQEKVQVVAEDSERESHQWVFPSEDLGGLSGGSVAGARGVYHRRITANMACGDGGVLDVGGTPVTRLNVMPSTGINEAVIDEEQMTLSRRAGDTDVSGYTSSTQALRDGFTRCPMDATDDQYTGQHADLFYETPEGKDDAGDAYASFVERNNYLDRL